MLKDEGNFNRELFASDIELIRLIISHRKLTYKELAKKLQCNYVALWSYKNLKQIPNVFIMARICKILNVEINRYII